MTISKVTKALGLLAGIAAFWGGARVQAGVLYQTGFEATEGYVAGQPITGQNGWINLFGNSTAIVSTTNPASGSQALLVPGTDMTDVGGGLSGARYRPDVSVFQLNPTVTPVALFQADVRLNGPLTPPPIIGDLVSANLTVVNNSPTNSILAELYVSSDGDVWADNANNNFGGSYLFGTPATTGTYYQLGLLLDFPALTADAYVNGTLIGTMALPPDAATTDGVRFDLSMFGVDGVDFTTYSAQFDNILVESVPEPPSVMYAAVLAVVGLVWRLRRAVGRREHRT